MLAADPRRAALAGCLTRPRRGATRRPGSPTSSPCLRWGPAPRSRRGRAGAGLGRRSRCATRSAPSAATCRTPLLGPGLARGRRRRPHLGLDRDRLRRTGRAAVACSRRTWSRAPSGWRRRAGRRCSRRSAPSAAGWATAGSRSTTTTCPPATCPMPGALLRAGAQPRHLRRLGPAGALRDRLPGHRSPGARSTTPRQSGLTRLVGANRAQVLTLLDEPHSTTQLAALTGLPLGAVGNHLGCCWSPVRCCVAVPA